ncbi:hypothetical protein [Actinomadura violacea]|uniref:Secreted protein n=1 Tax=Actinomadura violacea TaxID=2819934 RepID=A0ABS3S3Y5_9ACTN|nr:hypothetical protein [Actinomadura violacea]MBO2463708.1 hypothetical protein [Actinomadura violacea]
MTISRRRPFRALPAGLAAAATAAALATAAAPARADAGWTVDPTPFTLFVSNLYAVSGTGPGDVWVGGYQWYTEQSSSWCGEIGGPCTPVVHENPTLQHWNGSGWSWVGTPGLSGHGRIQFVDAASPSDVWAAGTRDNADGKGIGTPYIAHSAAQGWQEVAAPAALEHVDSLDAGPAGVWIAGAPKQQAGPSVYRWADGTWTPQAPDATIQAVGQRTADDVWAVGAKGQGGYAARYDGSAWHDMTPPQMQGQPGRLVAVLPLAAGDVWATGYVMNGTTPSYRSYHWDGSSWREDALPADAPLGGGYRLLSSAGRSMTGYSPDGLAADGAGGVWAVVNRPDAKLLHYSGGAWKVETTIGDAEVQYSGVARVPGGALMAVGKKAGKPIVVSRD